MLPVMLATSLLPVSNSNLYNIWIEKILKCILICQLQYGTEQLRAPQHAAPARPEGKGGEALREERRQSCRSATGGGGFVIMLLFFIVKKNGLVSPISGYFFLLLFFIIGKKEDYLCDYGGWTTKIIIKEATTRRTPVTWRQGRRSSSRRTTPKHRRWCRWRWGFFRIKKNKIRFFLLLFFF